MPRHEEQATLAYGADELFAVVADVKDYPSFVPWCSGARVHREDEREIVADLVEPTAGDRTLDDAAHDRAAGFAHGGA